MNYVIELHYKQKVLTIGVTEDNLREAYLLFADDEHMFNPADETDLGSAADCYCRNNSLKGYVGFVGTAKQYLRHLANQNFNNTLTQRIVNNLGGDQDIVMEWGYYDRDNGQQRSIIRKRLSAIVYDEVCDRKYNHRWQENISNIKSLNELADRLQDNADDYLVFFGTEEDYNKREQENRRKELEGLASGIAQKHNVSVNSVEFIKAVREEIRAIEYEREEWNNPEVRMEEWAACRYNGLGSDVYFDDLNYVNGNISSRAHNLSDILEWLSQNCPLLWAKAEEQRLSEEE